MTQKAQSVPSPSGVSRTPNVVADAAAEVVAAKSGRLMPRFVEQRPFKIHSPFKPTGDQPQAIEQLTRDLRAGAESVCLLGATGTGKTFTMANVIERLGKPTLIISHNKTLAAQLYEELKEFFPENSVNYFVSYYDYYQPEAYIPQRDIYIEKDSSRNDELDQLRLAATSNILSRRDTIVIASVSCIFGLGSPLAYGQKVLTITRGTRLGSGIGSSTTAGDDASSGSGSAAKPTKGGRREFLLALNAMQYQRTDIEFKRGQYRVRGDCVEIWPAYEKYAVRVELFGDDIDRIELINPTSGEVLASEKQFFLFPAVHYVMPEESLTAITAQIRADLDARVLELRSQGKLLEAQRLLARTKYDLEMIDEVGYCNGVENYSRYFDGRSPGERPYTLMDYFDFAPEGSEGGRDQGIEEGRDQGMEGSRDQGSTGRSDLPAVSLIPRALDPSIPSRPNFRDWLLIIDESHVTVPQVRAMFNGDRARKTVLVEHGFRLPAALDNRPLRFEEFEAIVPRAMFVSATPGPYELERCQGVVAEQVIRPTGLLDPKIEIRPANGQVKDLLARCQERAASKERVLVTALTKRLCEDLASYLDENGLRVRYLHSEIETLDRIEILNDLRKGEFEVLVGVNLLREGLDLPEVSLVCILDADKEGFLRSPTSLIQQMGRAARNAAGFVVMYADKVTPAMQAAIEETERRRAKQIAYNREHNITPTTIQKSIRQGLDAELKARRTASLSFEGGEEGSGWDRSGRSGKSGKEGTLGKGGTWGKEGRGTTSAGEGGGAASREVEKLLALADIISEFEADMLSAAENLEFEKAARARDCVKALKELVAKGETHMSRGALERLVAGAAGGSGSGRASTSGRDTRAGDRDAEGARASTDADRDKKPKPPPGTPGSRAGKRKGKAHKPKKGHGEW